MRHHRALYDQLCSDGVVDHSDYDNLDEIPTSTIPHLTLPVSDAGSDDSVDWKLKYESLKRDVDMSPRPSHTSPTHMDWKSMYTSIAEENETLRAKLGRFGLPTECSPEEDYVHLGTQYDIAIHENEVLRAQVRACEKDQMAAQSAARETAAREYRLTCLDSTDESLCEQVDAVICDTSGSSVLSQDGNMLIEGDVRESRLSLQEMHMTLVSDHATLKERYSELMRRSEGLTDEGKELERNAGLDDSREETEGMQLRQEVESLRRQLDVATEEQQSKDVRYGTLFEEHTALVDSNKLLVEQLRQAEHVRSTMSTERTTGEATQTSDYPVEDSDNHDQHVKQDDGKQQSVDKTASSEDYKALMVTHEALKEEFQTAQSKAKRDYTKMKAKAVAATRLAEQLKEQLSAAGEVSDPTSDVSEQLEDYKGRLVVLGEKYQQSQQDVGALKEEQYHYGEDVKSLTVQRDRCVEDLEEQKVTIDSLGQKNFDLQEKVTVSTAKIDELEYHYMEDVKSLTEQRDHFAENIEEQKVTIDTIGQQNVALQEKVVDVTARVEEFEALRQTERASLVENVEEQKVTIDSLGQKNVVLQEKVTDATAQMKELEYHYTEDVKSLTEQRDRCVVDVEEQKVTIDSLGQENIDLHNKVTVATAKIEELEALWKTERASLVENVEEQKVTIDSLGRKNVDLQEKVTVATAKIEELEAQRKTEQNNCTEDVKSLTEQRDCCVEDVEELKVTIDSLGQKNVQLQENVADAKARIEELEELRKTEQYHYTEGVKSLTEQRDRCVEDVEDQRVTIDSLGQKNVNLQEKVAEATARIEEIEVLRQTDSASLVEDVEEKSVTVNSLSQKNVDLQEKVFVGTAKIDELEALRKTEQYQYTEDVRSLTEQRDHCVEDVEELKVTIDSLGQQNVDLQENVFVGTAKIDELEALRKTEQYQYTEDVRSLTEQRDHCVEDVEELKVTIDSLGQQNVDLQENVFVGTAKIDELEALRTTEQYQYTEDVRSLTEQRDRCVEDVEELKVTIDSLGQQNFQLQENVADAKAKIEELEALRQMERASLVVDLEERRFTIDSLGQKNVDLQENVTDANARIEELEALRQTERAALIEENSKLKAAAVDRQSGDEEAAIERKRYDEIDEEMITLRAKYEGQETEMQQLQRARVETENQERQELESTRTELESSKRELESTRTELESTKAAMESTEGELESTREELNSTKTELESSRKELDSTHVELDSSRTELEGTKEELECTETKLESTKADIHSTMTELECIKTGLDSSKAELESTIADVSATKAELESTQEVLESTKQDLESTKAHMNSSKAELHSTQFELESMNADLESSKAELESTGKEVESMNTRLESTKTELVKLQEEDTAHVHENQPTEAEHLQTSVRTEDGLRDGERHRSVADTFEHVPAQIENNNLSSGSGDQLVKVTQDLGDMASQCDSVSKENETLSKKNETLSKKNETLRGENESLRSQLIAVTDKVEEQVEKMRSAYDTIVEENDTNLVDVKRLATKLSAAEAQCDQLQTQLTGATNGSETDANRQLAEELTRVADLRKSDQASLVQMEAKYKTLSDEHKALCAESSTRQKEVHPQTDQTSLVQMEAKYEVLSEEYKAIHAESSTRQKEVQRLEERLRSTAVELDEHTKEMAVVTEERATEREWFDLELQDWQSRYDAVNQESRQLKKVLSSGAASDTLATELLGLQHRYEEIVDERRLLRCAVDEHKTCAVAAEMRVVELEARIEQLLLESPEVESSPVSLGDVSVESVRLHVVGDDRASSSSDRVDLGGVDPGDHSQIGVTSDVCRPSDLPPCFDAFPESPLVLSRSVLSVDAGGSSVTTDDVRSDVADSDTSGDNTCDSLTQTCDTVKGAGDNSVRGSVPSSQKPRRESVMPTTKNASSRRQTALTVNQPSQDKTGRKGMVKKPATPKVRQPGTGETKRDKSVTTQESLGVKTATKSSSNVSSLELDNDKLRTEYQKLCEKMKRSTAKAAEDLAKMKRMYESAVKEKMEVKPKTPTQKPSPKAKKVESVPHREADSRRLRSDKTCSKEPNKLKKDMSGHRGPLGEDGIRDTANRGRDTTSEQHSGTSRSNWSLMVCVQCEILLAEKTDLCLKFDSERSHLKDEVEEMSVRLCLSQSDDAAMLAHKNKALVEQLRSLRSELRQDSEDRVNPVAGRHQLEQLNRQLNDVVVVNEVLKQEASDLRRQLDTALAATHKSPQRQPGDGSSHVTSSSNTLLTRLPFVQRSNPDVSHSSGSMSSFGDDFGLSLGRSIRMSDVHQSVTLLSHPELLLQYEILLQEKTELCVRLDEKIAEIEALTEKQNELLSVGDKKRDPDQVTLDNGPQLKSGTAECQDQSEAFQMDQVENEKLTQDVAGLRQQLDQALCDRHQLESKLEDLTFKNDELVSILETCESPESKGNSVESGSGDIGGARLEACEQQWGTLSREKCSLLKELVRCKKEMVDGEQVKSNLGTKQDSLQTDVSIQDAELTMSNLLPPEGAGDLSIEVGRLTREVEKWRRLNSDLCRVCQSFDDRVVSLSAQLDELSVINSDLRAENAVLVFEREDWTSGSEDVTELRGTYTGLEIQNDYKNQQDGNAQTVKDGGEFDHEERASDFSKLVHAVEQTELLEGDVMQKVGDTAVPVESSHSEVVKKRDDSSCDKVECRLKDEFIKRLESQLSRQQCDIQRAALEYKLMISLLSEVTSEQQGSDADTQGQSDSDMSFSTCFVDGLTVTSIAELQHGDTDPMASPGEPVCRESLDEKATFEMTKHEVERLEMEISRLMAENVTLSKRCREQEAIISQLRHPACMTDARDASDEQVVSLLKQRDKLEHQVEALKVELRKFVSVEAKFAAERSKTEQLEQELLQERVALGRHIRERHRLVDLLHHGAGAREGGPVDETGDRKDSGKSNHEEDQVHKSRRVQKKDVLWRRAVDGGCGRKVRLKCGCSVEVGGRKMHVHCEYHRAIERLRVALAHTDARRHKHVIPAIPPH